MGPASIPRFFGHMTLLTLPFTLQDRGGCCRMINYRHVLYYTFLYWGEVSIPLNIAVTRFSRLLSYRRKDRSPLSTAVTRFATSTLRNLCRYADSFLLDAAGTRRTTLLSHRNKVSIPLHTAVIWYIMLSFNISLYRWR